MPAIKQDETAEEFDADLEYALLATVFVKWYGAVLTAVHTIATRMLAQHPPAIGPTIGPGVNLDDAAIRQAVLKAQAEAVVVDAQTRKLIAERIAEGHARGMTLQQIAYGKGDYGGVAGLFDQTWKSRPMTIARTELQKAQLDATINRFQTLARGRIIGWLASDGDYDSYCASRDGRTYPPNSPPSLAHPRCRLTINPILGP